MDMIQDKLKYALITPSYAPDFERCKLLTESVKHCLTDGTKHYIIVDRRDVTLFKQLTSQTTEILVVEEILPSWIFRMPGFQGWWMSLRTLPIRNWVLQQLVKMSVCDVLNEDILVFCDSDNTFIRPFDMKSRLMHGTKVPLLRVDLQFQDVYEWFEASKKILGISDKEIQPVTYVSNMITWYKPNILKMRSHIEETHGEHWISTICRHRNISEYTIYGIFVEHVLGIEAANHFFFDTELIRASWGNPLNTEAQIQDFFAQVKENHIGVMIHSKDNVPVNYYADEIRTRWT